MRGSCTSCIFGGSDRRWIEPPRSEERQGRKRNLEKEFNRRWRRFTQIEKEKSDFDLRESAPSAVRFLLDFLSLPDLAPWRFNPSFNEREGTMSYGGEGQGGV